MHLSKPLIKSEFPDFGKRSHGESEFWQVAERRKLDINERKLKKRGYYAAHPEGNLIFINSKAKRFLWLCIAYHELVHDILHIPAPFLASKHQFEANAFSIMLICTLDDLRENSEMRMFARYDHVARFAIRQREQIKFLYQDFGFN